MTKKYIYLAGPIAQCNYQEANDWRSYVRSNLHENIIGISPLRCEPMHGETYGPGNDPRYNSPGAIAAKNWYDTEKCDLILAYMPRELNERRPSYGTTIEIGWAIGLKKPIILVTNDAYLTEHPLIRANVNWVFEDFENALAVSKDAGELPIILGGADGWPIIHVWGIIDGAFVDPNHTRGWIFNPKNFEFNTPSRMDAAKKLADMAAAGYFGSDSLGIGYDDANAMFINGDGVFNLTGTWMTAQLDEGMGDNVGAFAMPTSGGKSVAGGGSFALGWHISSKASNPDLAAKFIAHLMSKDFVDDLMEVGRVPAQAPTISPTSNLQAEVIASSNALIGANAKTFYTDWATPGMYDVVTQELQKLIGGVASAEEFISAMAAESLN